MAVKRAYPRSTVRKIVKAHSNRNISKNADIFVRRRWSQKLIKLINPGFPRLHSVCARVCILL